MLIRSELKGLSKSQLRGKWAITGGLFLLLTVVMVVGQMIPFIGTVFPLIFGAPMALGMAIISIKVTRNEVLRIDDSWSGFLNFGRAIGLYFWMSLWIFLWTLLLIIPGMIKSISYSMAFFILADNPNIGVREALNESKLITEGHKWELFVLSLSFMGWGILATFTLGIGYFWLMPYMQVTYANTYKQLANKRF